MRILPRPIGALILVAIAAGAYGGYERLQHRRPSARRRGAQTGRAAAHAPHPAAPRLRRREPRREPPPVEPPARMTSAQQAGFDAWLVKTYLQCWKPARQPADADVYVAQVRLAYNPDGSLPKPAKLVNPPSDPALKPQAKSVMAAVAELQPASGAGAISPVL